MFIEAIGLLPPEEVEKECIYDVKGISVTLQAGVHGYAEMIAGTNIAKHYLIDDTVENNFNRAFEMLKRQFKDLPIVEIHCRKCILPRTYIYPREYEFKGGVALMPNGDIVTKSGVVVGHCDLSEDFKKKLTENIPVTIEFKDS